MGLMISFLSYIEVEPFNPFVGYKRKQNYLNYCVDNCINDPYYHVEMVEFYGKEREF